MQSHSTANNLPFATQVELAARSSAGTGTVRKPSPYTVKWMRDGGSVTVAEYSDLFNSAVTAALGTGLQSIYTVVRVPHQGQLVTCRVFEKGGC